ncbi:MAG: Ig-like domain-containing protein [Patescibacteria group bacterium]|nr:Ig-like domain-containing protein [Patescibacteria group bacterium]
MKMLKDILKRCFAAIKNFYFPEDIHEHLKVKITVGRFFLSFLFLGILFSTWLFLPSPKATLVLSENETLKAGQPIEIVFSRPVKRNEVDFKISPEVPGSLTWQGSFLGSNHLFNKLVFTPNVILDPDKDYKIEIKGVKRVITLGRRNNLSFNLKTQKVPNVAAVTPLNGAKDIRADDIIKISLSDWAEHLAAFSFEFSPKVDYDLSYDLKKMEFIVKPKKPLTQGTAYELTVYRTIIAFDLKTNKILKRGTPTIAYKGAFTVMAAPGITSFTPTGDHVLVTNRELKLVFSQDMDKKSVEDHLEITPPILGDISWPDDKTLIYTASQNLSYETNHNFKIKSGAKNKKGGFVSEDLNNYFMTIGKVYVWKTIPGNGEGGVRVNSNVAFFFDQAVDHVSAESHFSISDGRAGAFSWEGNALIFNPNDGFAKDASYTITMSAGVKSINGLDSASDFSSTFYTESNYVKLDVPLDYQDYPLSCEVAALKMALAYRETSVSEDELMGWIGYDPTPHIGGTWGDPYEAFVGSITGVQNSTGYGVYWGPIEKSAKHYRNAQAFTGWSAVQLAQEIEKGNPVIIWGVYPGGYYDPWMTPGGKFIPAWKGEHARTVIGFTGPSYSPIQFILNDPVSGQLYWSLDTLINNWSAFETSGVVVY